MRQCKRALAALGLSLMLGAPAAHAQLLGGLQDTLGEVLNANAPDAIEGQYIVVLEEDAGPIGTVVHTLLNTVGGRLLGELPIINAAVVRVDALSARILAASPGVDYVDRISACT